MAQPSGLSVSADGTTLWVADSESSALRYVRHSELHTAVGQGLFDFGHMDGPAEQALFQHPLGVCALDDGSVLVADTYNGSVRRYDPETDAVSTVATGLAEPSDIVILPDGGVMVVESAAHRLTRLALRRTVDVGPGEVAIAVAFIPPPGETLDDRYGPATSLTVTGLATGASQGAELTRRIHVETGQRLRASAYAASCDEAAEHPACHLARRDWDLRVVPGGPTRVELVLGGHG
jgi:hypothetical protein